MPEDRQALLNGLRNIATQLRIDSIQATSAAGSGHPTSSMSAAEIMAALFFAEMRFDPKRPAALENDKFVLSKGHAAPVLYAVWAELGFMPREHLLTLRRFDSDLEGHPTPILPFVAARIESRPYRTYVLMGDGETAEGSVWEAAQVASHHGVDNLCAIVDVNRLGQSQPTMLQHQMEVHQRRWEAFGWNALVVNGHDLGQLLDAFAQARAAQGRPTVILARTLKGRGVSFLEDKEGWHGKALKKGAETEAALKELQAQFVANGVKPVPPAPVGGPPPAPREGLSLPRPPFDKPIATREA